MHEVPKAARMTDHDGRWDVLRYRAL